MTITPDDDDDAFAYLKDVPDEEFIASSELAEGGEAPEAETGAEVQDEGAPAERAETDAEPEKPKRRPGKLERQNARLERELAETRKAMTDLQARASQAEQGWTSTHSQAVNALTAKLAADRNRLKSVLATAWQNGDQDAYATATEELGRVSAQEQELSRVQAPQPTRQPTAPQYSSTAKDWMEVNPWFGSDRLKTDAAKLLHQDAVARGMKIDSDDYYQHIESGVEKLYPGTVKRPDADDEDDAPAAPVSRARAASPGVTKTVATMPVSKATANSLPKLTASEVDMARSLGMSAKEYAIEKMKLEKAGRLSHQKYR